MSIELLNYCQDAIAQFKPSLTTIDAHIDDVLNTHKVCRHATEDRSCRMNGCSGMLVSSLGRLNAVCPKQIQDENERLFIQQITYGCVRYKKMCKVCARAHWT